MPIQGGIRVAMNRIKSPCDRTQGPKPRVTTLLLGKTILSLLLLTSISPDAQAEPHRFQYYRPILILCAHSQNQSKLEDKFGGIPHGFPVKKWPCCSGCRRPMSLLAQLVHSKERLDLGGRVAHSRNRGIRKHCHVVDPDEIRADRALFEEDNWWESRCHVPYLFKNRFVTVRLY